MLMEFSTPAADRRFEDYIVGATYRLGSFAVTEDEIIQFARQYDPQTMHVDRAIAGRGPYGGVIASGWQTVALAMRLLVDNFLPHDGLAAPGIDELRWPLPVRPGDTLTVQATIQQARRSRSKPDRGLIHGLMEVLNQHGEVVMSMKPMNFVRVRTPEV